MPIMELLANDVAQVLGMLKMHLADFSDADLMIRPVPSANHAAWQLGHLVYFETMLCNTYAPSAAPKLPEDAKATFGKAGSKSDDASKFWMKDDVIKLLEQTHGAIVQWIRDLPAEDLDKPGPEALRSWVPTIGKLILAIGGHITMHIGQIQVIRRKLEKPNVF